ncbi:hypothetical protein L6R52_25805 [Myxococcota bacterium]|nr:hypothetical protein [Myxococcota bacterium]
MTAVARFVLAILDALDGLARRDLEERPPEPMCAPGAPADREPETISDLVAGTSCEPAPVASPTPPRVLGYVLIAPGTGALVSVGACIPREGRDGEGAPFVGWARQLPERLEDLLVLPSEDAARRLLWSLRMVAPNATEVLPVVVGT